MAVSKMRDSVPSARYSPVCNVLRQWKTSLIPTYTVYRLYAYGYSIDTVYTYIYFKRGMIGQTKSKKIMYVDVEVL